MNPLAHSHARRGRSARLLPAAALLALGLAAAGCADQVTQPTAAAPEPRASHAGSAFHAQFAIPIRNDLAFSQKAEQPWINTGIVVPRTGRYRMRVDGVVTVSRNPAWPGRCTGARIEESNLGDWRPSSRHPGTDAPLRVRFFVQAASIFHPGFNHTTVTPTSAEAEQRLDAGQTIWITRNGLLGYVYCGAGTETPMYLYSGSQTFSIEEVSSPAQLVVECNGARNAVSVERGATLSCTAKAEPAGGTVTDARWTFEDTRRTQTVSGPAGQNAWAGPMAVGGTVRLAARVNGTERTAQVAVTVTPRPWRDALPEHRTVHCPAAAVSPCPLTSPAVHDRDIGVTSIRRTLRTLAPSAITDGPNTGWYFVAGTTPPLRFSNFTTYLNSELLNPRSRLFRGGCTVRNVTDWITAHEGVHVTKIRNTIDDQKLNPEMEEVVAFGEDAFRQRVRREEARVERVLRDLGDGNHSDKNYPANPCDLPTSDNP